MNFFNKKKGQNSLDDIVELAFREVIAPEEEVGFSELSDYNNMLLRLFIHSEAMMLAGSKEGTIKLANTIAKFFGEKDIVNDSQLFIAHISDIFNQAHVVWAEDISKFEGAMPLLNFKKNS